MSNPKPIEQAMTPDLRNSRAALLRAAQRARHVAAQTGTALVVYREGRLLLVDPSAGGLGAHRVAEPGGTYDEGS